MRFEDSFVVPVDPATAWEVLTDIGRVAPCLPGAQLVEIRDDEFHGLVRLKFGPIQANYKGTARFESLDPESRRLVIKAQGRDEHGQGTASARIEAVLDEHDGATMVRMVQDITITGKAAQFGRGVLTDVSKQMMGQFATSLTEMLGAEDEAQPAAPTGARPAGLIPAASDPIDLASLARGLAVRRLPAVLAAAGAATLLLVMIRRLLR